MAYTASTFVNNSTTVPVSAAELNKLGDGIAEAQAIAEEAASTAAAVMTATALVQSGLSGYTAAVRTSDATPVTATTLTADADLTIVLSGVAGARIAVTFDLIFRGDASGGPTVKFGIEATNSDLDVTGHLTLTARDASVNADQVSCVALSAGLASITVPVLSGTTAGTDPVDVHYAVGNASILVGSDTSSLTVAVVTAQNAAGTGVKILKGSCLTTEVLS